MYSFDVFDTLITRATATPYGIFALMRERLRREQAESDLEDYVIENFYELRIHSEELMRKSASCQKQEEISLRDIYRAMALCGCLDRIQVDLLCSLEEQMELANVVGIDANIQRVRALLAQGERVILISDMYLSENVIRAMLMKVDPIFQAIPLYVSSEYGKRKTTGNLYRQVQEMEKVPYERWTHIGDNLFQDIEIPSRLGIKVKWWETPKLTELEQELLERREDDGKLQLMIKAVCSWMQASATDMSKGVCLGGDAYDIGRRYAGPILYSYAEWIVEQAVKKGVQRLYFIARDGYLVKRLVDFLLGEKGLEIETSYIYGSRKAWRMASLSERKYDLYQLIFWCHHNHIRTLENLAEVLHISLQELYPYLPGTYAKDRTAIDISDQELEYIAGWLSESGAFKAFHLRKLADERGLVQRYLEQVIDISDDQFAFVEVSGGGMTQGCLYELLKERYPKPIRTFFFKIDRVGLVKESITYTFLPSYLENNLTVEMMCRAPHGQTKGYMEKDGKVVPILEETETRELIEHGFYAYEKGILDLARCIAIQARGTYATLGSLQNVISYLQYIAQRPSKDVLDFFASMPGNETGRDKASIEYAPRLTEEDIQRIFLERTYEPLEHVYPGTNLMYSLLRASEEEKALIERCRREHDQAWGHLARQEKERREKELRRHYGRAAFYPVRLLEEKVILYGAGKLGRDLYKRLEEDQEHEVILWVDQNASACRQAGIKEVCAVSEIKAIDDIPIVIAVIDRALADDIREGLEAMGIDRRRTRWFYLWGHPCGWGEWDERRR